MICKNCGAELNPEDKFCNSCGTAVNPLTDEEKFSPKPEEPKEAPATEDPYSSLDPATNPVDTTPQNNGFVAPQSGEFTASQPNPQGTPNVGANNTQYVPNTVGPQQGNNNTNYNPQYNPNLNTNKKSSKGCLIAALVTIGVFLLIGIIVIALIVHGARSLYNKTVEYGSNYTSSYYDDDDDYYTNYSSSRNTTSTAPYSGYSNSTYSRNTIQNTTSQNTVSTTEIPDNLDNAVYSYTNDVAVQFKTPTNLTKIDSESTSLKKSYYSGTTTNSSTVVVATIVDGTVSSLDSLNMFSNYGITSQDITVSGITYKKVSVSSDLVSTFVSNTTASGAIAGYVADIYYYQLNEKCMYQVTVLTAPSATNTDVTDLLTIKYGEIDY